MHGYGGKRRDVHVSKGGDGDRRARPREDPAGLRVRRDRPVRDRAREWERGDGRSGRPASRTVTVVERRQRHSPRRSDPGAVRERRDRHGGVAARRALEVGRGGGDSVRSPRDGARDPAGRARHRAVRFVPSRQRRDGNARGEAPRGRGVLRRDDEARAGLESRARHRRRLGGRAAQLRGAGGQ